MPQAESAMNLPGWGFWRLVLRRQVARPFSSSPSVPKEGHSRQCKMEWGFWACQKLEKRKRVILTTCAPRARL